MLEHVNIDVLANWVSMLRTDIDGAILLSDDDDEARFYEMCTHEKARVVPAREVALALLEKMERRGIRGVVAAYRGSQRARDTPNAFRPSVGDVASLLILSKSCDEVVREICGSGWLRACDRETGSIRQRVVWVARTLSRLRQVCADEKVQGPIDWELSEIIDWNTFCLNWDRLVALLAGKGLSRGALEEVRAIRPGIDLRSDLLEFDGMEAVHLFAVASRMYRPLGIAPFKEIEPASFIGMLRLAYDLHEFEGDEEFWQMRGWERANARYPLLRQWRTLDSLGTVWDQRYWESDLATFLGLLKPGDPLAMFKVDLDEFKQVNENLGHIVGDEAIRVYCKVVKGVLGGVGEVYRRGGDEVVVLAPGLCEASARELAEITRADVEKKLSDWAAHHGLKSAPTASIGLALTVSGATSSEVILLADEAQQRAKRQGKNRVVVLP